MSLWQMSLYGAVMILVIAVLRQFFMNRLPKTTFFILWGLVLVRLLIPFQIPSTFSAYSLLPEQIWGIGGIMSEDKSESFSAENTEIKAVDSEISKQQEKTDTGVSGTTEVGTVEESKEGRHMAEEVVVEEAVAENTVAEGAEQSAFTEAAGNAFRYSWQAWRGWFTEMTGIFYILWAAGVCICGSYFFLSYRKCRKEFQTALPVKTEFTESWLALHPLRRRVSIRSLAGVETPLTYGIFHPVILLPKRETSEDTAALSYILEHEFVHIKRGDAVFKLLMTAALCIHWYNPFVWLMYVLFNRDIELSCDEAVLRRLGEEQRASYAYTLIGMEEKRSGLVPFYSSFSRNAMEERITAIMKTKKKTAAAGICAVVLVGAVAVGFATTAENAGKKGGETVLVQSEEGRAALEQVQTVPYEELLKEYEKFGITETGQEGKEKLLYKGEPVRYFLDGYERDNGQGGLNTISRFCYLNQEGTVDVHTVREDKQNADGSTELFGTIADIVPYSEEEFAARDITVIAADGQFITEEASALAETEQDAGAAEQSGNVTEALEASGQAFEEAAQMTETAETTATAQGMNLSGFGKTFEEYFAAYEKYGITYERTADGQGNVFLNGEPVARFIDENTEKSFAFSSQNENGSTVYVAYEKHMGHVIKGIVKDEEGLITRISAGEIPMDEIYVDFADDSLLVFHDVNHGMFFYSREEKRLLAAVDWSQFDYDGSGESIIAVNKDISKVYIQLRKSGECYIYDTQEKVLYKQAFDLDKIQSRITFHFTEDYVNPDYTVSRSKNCIDLGDGQYLYVECGSGIMHDMYYVIEDGEGERETGYIFPDLEVEQQLFR